MQSFGQNGGDAREGRFKLYPGEIGPCSDVTDLLSMEQLTIRILKQPHI